MKKIVIRNQDFIRLIGQRTNFRQQDIREVMYAATDALAELLGEASSSRPVEVKIAPEIAIISKERSATRKVMPNGKELYIAPVFKTSARFSGDLRFVPGKHEKI